MLSNQKRKGGAEEPSQIARAKRKGGFNEPSKLANQKRKEIQKKGKKSKKR